MNYIDFEKEIQKLDPRFTIVPNPNRGATNGNTVGLNNIMFEGANYDLPVVADEIKENVDPGYFYIFPNGYSSRIWSQGEVIARLTDFLTKVDELKEVYAEN
jgi:hypothetical protein